MSLLTLCQDAAGLLTLARPSIIINSPDLTGRQLNMLAVQEATALNRLWWKAMTREHTFTTVATAAQTGAVPSDLDRFWPNSFQNRTTQRHVIGPVSAQDWQRIQATGAVTTTVLGYRQRDSAFLMTPTPAADETIAYEYISTKWARSSDLATAKTRWEVDTDTSYFDEWLITLGIVWRWKASKGLPYAEEHDAYTDHRSALMGNDGGSTTLSIAPACPPVLTAPTIPEGFSY